MLSIESQLCPECRPHIQPQIQSLAKELDAMEAKVEISDEQCHRMTEQAATLAVKLAAAEKVVAEARNAVPFCSNSVARQFLWLAIQEYDNAKR